MRHGPANGCPRSRNGRRPRGESMGAVSLGARSSPRSGATRQKAELEELPRWANMERQAGRPMARRIWLGMSGSGPRVCGRRRKYPVCFGAALGTALVTTPPARVATALTRDTASTTWGFVALGHSVTLSPFSFYPLFSVNCILWVQGEALPKSFGEGLCQPKRTE